MKTLVLCRHAKSDWPVGVDDIDRPLKGRGIADADRQGALLASHGFQPDLIISSPANRALTTAQLIAKSVGYDPDTIRVKKDIYFQGLSGLFGQIEQLPQRADTVMIFGHNPTMEEAVRRIIRSDAPYSMPTLGMACLEGTYATDWKKFMNSYVSLRWILIPRLARKE